MYPDHEGLWYAIFRMSCKGGGRVYSFLREKHVRSDTHNSKIADALKGVPLTTERKNNISNARINSPNTPKGRSHPLSNKELWDRESEIKSVWLTNNKPKWIKLRTLIGLTARCKTLYTMVKKFEEEDIV
jgi:hypothetical protein